MLDADGASERLHLAERFGVGRVRGRNLPVPQQVHHAVHHVVRQMAVDHPRAGIFRFEFHYLRLRHSDEHCVRWIPGRFRRAAAFRARDYELMSMQVNRMMIHAEIDKTQSYAATETNN